MKNYKLATVLLSASLALSACGSDSEKEESKNDSEETTSAATSAAVHKKDTPGESKETKTTGNLPDKEQQALDGALLMFTHAKNKNFDAFKNDMKLRSKFSMDMYQSEPADSEYKEIMLNWATLNYADFNLRVIDWDKLSDATQIEMGEDYGGDSVLVSVTTKDDTLTQEEKEGMDIVLIMNKYNNRYMIKEFKAADIIQDDINEQMYANTSSAVKDTDSGEVTEEKTQKESSSDQTAIDSAKQLFKDAEDGNESAFNNDVSYMRDLPQSEIEWLRKSMVLAKYTDNFTFKTIDLESLPEDSSNKKGLIKTYGNNFTVVTVTNNNSTVAEEILNKDDSLRDEEPWAQKVAMDLLLIVEKINGKYKVTDIKQSAYNTNDIRDLMYEHDPDTLNELNKAIQESENESE
ncbi:hypothetical protein [Priestia megaterium]|uniref:hypothetical protein n=1 Tax=Priestia megaterium TaxID=1404 RepID=UPI0022B899BE|nr:hypothetical protein [Priestia megaterium]MCZ8493593.1 hypothetical protein [Priestia megaterium]